jgi:iron complex outermembrane receptor protein
VVWNAGKFTLDADIYYIDFKNKIQNITDSVVGSPTFGETYETNTGGAIYRGLEGQATYVLDHGFSVFGNASYNQAHAGKDVLNPGGNGHQLAKAPLWPGAWGLRYGHSHLLFGNDELISNLTTKMIGPQDINAAKGATLPNGHIKAFSNTDFTTTYRVGQFSLEAQVINLGDRTSVVSAKGSALKAGTSQLARTVADGGAANTFVYQAGRSYQVTLKMAF